MNWSLSLARSLSIVVLYVVILGWVIEQRILRSILWIAQHIWNFTFAIIAHSPALPAQMNSSQMTSNQLFEIESLEDKEEMQDANIKMSATIDERCPWRRLTRRRSTACRYTIVVY